MVEYWDPGRYYRHPYKLHRGSGEKLVPLTCSSMQGVRRGSPPTRTRDSFHMGLPKCRGIESAECNDHACIEAHITHFEGGRRCECYHAVLNVVVHYFAHAQISEVRRKVDVESRSSMQGIKTNESDDKCRFDWRAFNASHPARRWGR